MVKFKLRNALPFKFNYLWLKEKYFEVVLQYSWHASLPKSGASCMDGICYNSKK